MACSKTFNSLCQILKKVQFNTIPGRFSLPGCIYINNYEFLELGVRDMQSRGKTCEHVRLIINSY